MKRVFSYVVARDYGFAPNPFYGYCTLATCISPIRRAAMPGDVVIGSGSARKGLAGHLVYAMVVSEAMSFTDYWGDNRFLPKRPIVNGSVKQQYGDNIYRRDGDEWLQADSHHSLAEGLPNQLNITSDTRVDRILVGSPFTYWGRNGPAVPDEFRDWNGVDIIRTGVGHRHNFADDLVVAFLDWLDPLIGHGIVGRPAAW